MTLACCREISVVILSHNRRDELRRSLRSLIAPAAPWREIIVADNASADGTRQMLLSEFPQVRLVDTGGNHGILGSNLGYAAATGRWVLSLDDDSAPALESWTGLDGLLGAIEPGRDRVAAIALSVRSRVPPALPTPTPLVATFGFSAAGVLLAKEALEAIGGYEAELFLFTNELHWTAKALEAGWSLLKSDSTVVVHRSVPLQRCSHRHAYHYCRNLLLFTLRHAPDEEVGRLLSRQLADVAAFTVLHRTTAYLRAARDARRMSRRDDRFWRRLSPAHLAAINPDWRAPYVYLP